MAEFDLDWERLPLDTVRQLDALCDRFEQAVREDDSARLEPFIAGIAEPLQKLVLHELVRIEIEARRDEPVEPEEYAQRFPQWADELREIVPRALEDASEASVAPFESGETIDLSLRADDDTKKQSPDLGAQAGEGTHTLQMSRDANSLASLGALRHWLPADGVLGHYQIKQVIGRGGMGVVVRAYDTKLTRDVAIKFPDPRIVQDAKAKERFLREARAAAVVRHNHTVTIYAVEEINQIPFLVMELVEGMTLEAYVRDSGKLAVGEVASLAHQTAQGMAVAHQQGLIHRDIKPANILLEKNEQHVRGLRPLSQWHVKTTDFGLARAIGAAGLTQSGQIAGTPTYMSPEQAEGKHLDARTDLFSLGSVMYAMCAGRAPFQADSVVALLRQVADQPALPLREVAPETPDWLIAIIERLMAKSPEDRFESAAELAELLGHHILDLQGRPSGIDSVVEHVAADSRATWLAAIGGGLLLLAAIVYFALPASNVEVPANGKLIGQQQSPNVPTSNGDQLNANSVDGPGWHGWPADAPPPAIAPFDADQARAHQEAWAKYLGVPVDYTNSIGMTFRLIPPGEFTMGSTPEEIEEALKHAIRNDTHWQVCLRSEAPQHKVILTQPIYLSVHEVTQAEYEKVMGVNPSHFAPTGEGKEAVTGLETTNHPAEMVSWNDAAEFCAKLSKQEELKPFYLKAGETITPLDGTGYRHPTEAEWEYACRAGTTSKFWFGDRDEDMTQTGWYVLNSSRRPHAVGELQASPFGLFDMHGNVWEWVQDGWGASSYDQHQKTPAINPSVPFSGSSHRVVRGGYCNDSTFICRAATRAPDDPAYRLKHIGFRVSLPVDAVRQALKVTGPALPKQVATTPSAPASAKPDWHGWPAEAPPPAIAPFNAEQAKQHQEAWAKYLNIDVEYTNNIGMKFRLIPPGEFTMGSTAEEIEEALKVVAPDDTHWQERTRTEAPQHKVILTQPIFLGVHEVTQAEYEKVMGVNPSHFAPTGEGKEAVTGLDASNHPAEMVSWNDAAEFCAKLSKQEELKPFYYKAGETILPLDGTGYRLPAEAEWEYACRAGTTTRFWIGDKDEELVRVGWFATNSGIRTHAVGELKKNPFGLTDMHGNVSEWVEDWWDSTYYGELQGQDAINPRGPSSASARRVLRGGDSGSPASHSRAASRSARHPATRFHLFGFRVSLRVDAVRQALKVTGPALPKPLGSKNSNEHFAR